MPDNFLNTLSYIVAMSLGLAFIATLAIFGFTLFVVIFTYVFIPLFLIALIRWLWLRYKLSAQGRINYYDDK